MLDQDPSFIAGQNPHFDAPFFQKSKVRFIKWPAGLTGKPGTKLEFFKHEIRYSQTKKIDIMTKTTVNKTKRKEKQLAKSTLKPYVSVTLSHALRRKFVKDF